MAAVPRTDPVELQQDNSCTPRRRSRRVGAPVHHAPGDSLPEILLRIVEGFFALWTKKLHKLRREAEERRVAIVEAATTRPAVRVAVKAMRSPDDDVIIAPYFQDDGLRAVPLGAHETEDA